MKAKVIMVCKEIWRAEVIGEGKDMEEIKDNAWAQFDKLCDKNLEQENYTKLIMLPS